MRRSLLDPPARPSAGFAAMQSPRSWASRDDVTLTKRSYAIFRCDSIAERHGSGARTPLSDLTTGPRALGPAAQRAEPPRAESDLGRDGLHRHGQPRRTVGRPGT